MTRPRQSFRLAFRLGLRLAGWVALMFTAACASRPIALESAPVGFDRRSVAIITTPSAMEADDIRKALREGAATPPSARIVPIGELDRINPSLSTVAIRLRECEVSEPMLSNEAKGGYVLLQRGGELDAPCRQPPPGLGEQARRVEERAGELLMGLLLVGLIGFLAVLPFLFF
jgi:hypothetical protein